MRWLGIVLTLVVHVVPADAGTANGPAAAVVSEQALRAAPDGVQLNAGWRYHSGDGAGWAAVDLDDTAWEVVNPSLTPDTLPTTGWRGHGWFRLRLTVDESLRGRSVVFTLLQLGASEVYLDGRLVARFGRVGTSPQTELPDVALYEGRKIGALAFDDRPGHVLAVRYSSFTAIRQRPGAPHGFLLAVHDGDISDAIDRYAARIRQEVRERGFYTALPIAFSLLHLLLYLFYRRQRANLHYAAFTFAIGAAIFASGEAFVFPRSLLALNVYAAAFKTSLVVAGAFGARFVYELFHGRPPRGARLLGSAVAILAIAPWVHMSPSFMMAPACIWLVVAFLEMLRVVALAVKRGRPCAWVIAVGFLATGVSAAYSLTQFVLPGLFVPIPGQMLGILCLLISMSIYLARDVGQTNRDLETRSDELRTLNSELEARVEQRTEFIRSIFGRYLTDEVVESVLSDPEGLDVGGGKRTVTILMSDLRGFSTMAETMDPEQVVLLLNNYLGSMTDVIHRWEGTIDEFIGDAIMVLFGAPVWTDDHASRAVQCALEMQRAISGVNARNLSLGLPTVEMGIGVHTGDVVVGNIGSEKRAKYGVVGNAVNLAARIESFTDGGQVLVSEDTWRLVANVAEPAGTRTVQPKGLMSPITLYELKGEAAS
ncbi:hypothetical protein HN371_18555 [Candidatus Poribacteria bacterium]|jgi:class 3 adenylate cyclase|nr:hypothetical protein [Candidatus Poribacteria bacterium]MBT5534896.1 hypothetical protein [Candidatus Poribacteria bacterium]MBT7098506.1 hypothetical protein [Candidatus Poribacteria bacterium]MBT7804389.1 hypothetical protein [Candidatus Poribacteria bacterium]